ncbi:hypothetical protein [Amycolatopsis sp. cmx-4-68]|uniref:hypothetical protein n=1 Tax=Amycolatopsis sp. cmx-4-68 TaxID=2790938 RepID=UPI003979A77A
MPTLTELPQWTIRTSGDEVTFTHVPAERGSGGGPRVWSGRGLGLREGDLPAFGKALGEVMKLPAYWRARARSARPEADWSPPRRDPGDGFVYVTGPCRLARDHAGYEPVASFTLELADVRGLRVRIAAHLHLGRSAPGA